VVIATSAILTEEEVRTLMSAAAAVISKSDMAAEGARHVLHNALAEAGVGAR